MHRARWLYALLVLATPASADPCNARLPTILGTIFTGTVNYIIDGDSMCVNNIEVRLSDLDAAELSTPEGPAAKASLYRRFYNKPVTCIVRLGRNGHTTSYDRVIAECH